MSALVVADARALADFLGAHPWPGGFEGEPLEFLWHFDLRATPEELWPFIMDTSRFNRAMGMGRMDFREVEGVLHGSTKNLGLAQEWVEEPWTWVARRTMANARIYSRGFGRYVRSRYVLVPLDEKTTRLQVYFGWIARSFWSRALLKYSFPYIGQSFGRLLGEIEAHVADARDLPSPYESAAPPLEPEARSRLDALVAQVKARLEERRLDTAPLARLATHLITGDDLDLHRIQILPLARRWNLDASALLTTCLHATRLGLLNMSWDVICPHCRGVRQEVRTLGDVPNHGSCETCAIEFDMQADNALEITFHLHPSVREVPKVFYCAAEPSTKTHIAVQQRVAPGQRARVTPGLRAGRYRLRLQGSKSYRLLDVLSGSGPPEAVWRADDQGDEGDALTAGVGSELELVNDGTSARTFVVEEPHWSDDALRPVQLFSLQEFRDLFTEEYLQADVQLSIGEQSILFTDMIGSTRFYQARGDPEAFAEVKRHFREVYEAVRIHRGAVVKTIGDAVMAAFHSPVHALEAARAIHLLFPAGRKDTSIRLRISINFGPCIAVNLNSAIDYFGGTVNLASKLQACVEAGQVSFPRSMLRSPGVTELLEKAGARLEDVTVRSASLDAPIEACRWDVNDLSKPEE